MTEIEEIIRTLENEQNVLLHAPGGTGKCLHPDQKVIMYDGTLKKARHLGMGDVIMGVNEKGWCEPAPILTTCAGTDDMYQVILEDDGGVYTVNSVHLLTLKNVKTGKIIDLELNQYLQMSNYLRSQYVMIKSPITRENGPYEDEYGKRRHYSMGPIKDRLDTLNYLIYNYGSITPWGFTVRRDVERAYLLAQSLGMRCKVVDYMEYGSEGVKKQLEIRGSFLIDKDGNITIESNLGYKFTINYVGRGLYCGFTLGNPSGRFLLEDCIVTHNTYTIQKVAEHFLDDGVEVCCTATTGVAAITLQVPGKRMNASTIHSWSGIGLAQGTPQKILAKVRHNPQAVARWNQTKILVIDEVSMLGASVLDLLDYIGKEIRRRPHQPFGGLRVLLSGDFLQLPPVKDEFCFVSEVFTQLELVPFVFSEPKRYPDEKWFHLLLRIRMGKLMKSDVELLKSRHESYLEYLKKDQAGLLEGTVKPTILYSRKMDVAGKNDEELEKLPGGTKIYVSEDTFKPYNSHARYDTYIELLEDVIPKAVTFKVGAQVMLRYNMSVADGLVNGSRGVVVEMFDDAMKVKFVNNETHIVSRHAWKFEDKNGECTRVQMPFILAWASTIHRAQGSTLDYAVVDVGASVFAPGQAYVALSRARGSEGLFLSDFSTKAIKVNNLALAFSRRIEQEYELRQQEAVAFIDSTDYVEQPMTKRKESESEQRCVIIFKKK